MNPVGVTYGSLLDKSIETVYLDLIYQKKTAVCFKFNDDNSKIITDETSVINCESSTPYQQTLVNFTDDQCKFALVDIPCLYQSNAYRKRLVLVSWIPKSATLQQQMMVPPTFEKLQQKCVAIVASFEVQEKTISEVKEHLKGITEDTLIKIDGVDL